jgi:SAM-dependent methyltransferase
MEDYIADISRCLYGYGDSSEHDEQKRGWIRDRMEIVDCWSVQPGWRVLEIGCGNGWMTAALAAAVGDKGHVTAVDYRSTRSKPPIPVPFDGGGNGRDKSFVARPKN